MEALAPERTFPGADLTRMAAACGPAVAPFTDELPLPSERGREPIVGRAVWDRLGWLWSGLAQSVSATVAKRAAGRSRRSQSWDSSTGPIRPAPIRSVSSPGLTSSSAAPSSATRSHHSTSRNR